LLIKNKMKQKIRLLESRAAAESQGQQVK
jgi:hypothetical protein